MYSTRKRLTAALLTLSGAVVGCQRANQTQTAELNRTPIIEDDAMKLRMWSQSSATYPNGATVAGPTLFAREPRRGKREYHYLYTDTGVYAGNVFMLPYRFYQTPPWREVIYPGEVISPSHTAVPPILREPAGEMPLPAAAYDPMPIAPPATQPSN